MRREWFEDWFDSPYYHILYQSHDELEARKFIDLLLQVLSLAPDARVLDLACGKGRHARYLMEKGFDVTGLDIAASNIAHARQFENDRLSFYRQDMRRPFRYNYFDAIVNMFTSFGYFQSDKDHFNTLKNIQQGLNSKGVFFLDFFNAQSVRENMVRHEVKFLGGVEFQVTKTIRKDHVFKRVEFEAGGRHFVFHERVRLFELADFQALFKAAGLRIQQTFGGYNLEPFQASGSKRLLLIADKTA
ncbi:MAG: class I SAM-dependent methyltransferase [Saprospiraceae bacterium]|nr:class I SAM-dependent methyltransferase [Saprospiraceae bacterium]